MTKEQENYIIKKYSEGCTAVQIAKEIGLHNSTISRFVKKAGISRGLKSKTRLEIEKNVVKDFSNGEMYCKELAIKYGVSVDMIYDILDKADIQRKTGYRSNCVEDYFEKIDTPHKAYLLGFITADGAVVNNILSIEVHKDDREVLEFAKQEINPEAALTPTRNCFRVSFGAKKIGQDLQKYGVVQNKSKTLKEIPIDHIPQEFLPFYFRGLVDGDGCILKDGSLAIYSGSKDFIQSVQEILIQEANVSRLKIYHGTAYFIAWRGKEDKKKLYNYLYKDLNKTFYYQRKYSRLKDFILNYANTEVNN